MSLYTSGTFFILRIYVILHFMKTSKLLKFVVVASTVVTSYVTISDVYAPEKHHNIAMSEELNKSIVCLAQVMYDEARGETKAGKIAVGHVVVNRTKTWNRDVCGIVYHKRGKICQFSGMCKDNKPYSKETFELAYEILTGNIKDNTKGATYFHATYVKPNWSSIYKKNVKIGNHIFYESKQTL